MNTSRQVKQELWQQRDGAQEEREVCPPQASHLFVPVAIETFGVIGPQAGLFCQELGRCITAATLDPFSHQHLLQRVSIAVQCGNAAAVLGTLPRCSRRS